MLEASSSKWNNAEHLLYARNKFLKDDNDALEKFHLQMRVIIEPRDS